MTLCLYNPLSSANSSVPLLVMVPATIKVPLQLTKPLLIKLPSLIKNSVCPIFKLPWL